MLSKNSNGVAMWIGREVRRLLQWVQKVVALGNKVSKGCRGGKMLKLLAANHIWWGR